MFLYVSICLKLSFSEANSDPSIYLLFKLFYTILNFLWREVETHDQLHPLHALVDSGIIFNLSSVHENFIKKSALSCCVKNSLGLLFWQILVLTL